MKKKLITKLTGVLAVSVIVLLIVACSGQKDNPAESADATGDTLSSSEGKTPDFSLASVFIPKEKKEVVSASADATGTVSQVDVTATLYGFDSESGDYVKDTTTLTNLKNPNGAESCYIQDNKTVYWDNLGETITYKGQSDATLPINVKVTYYLDKKEMAPEDMLGVSGHVTIRFDYENTTDEEVIVNGKTYHEQVPFGVLSAAYLPSDNFSNVEVSGGKVEIIDGKYIAIGFAIPGLYDSLELSSFDAADNVTLKDYVEISADVTDFELEFTETIVTNGLFTDINDDSLKDLTDLTESMDDLESASDKLVTGAADLLTGAKDFKEYLKSYIDGVDELTDGISSLDNSLSDVDISALKNSESEELAQLAANIEALQKALKNLDKGGKKLDSAGAELLEGYNGIVKGIKSYKSGISKFDSEGIEELAKTLGDDLGDLLTRIKAVSRADRAYTNYSGSFKDQETSVTFLIETDGITSKE